MGISFLLLACMTLEAHLMSAELWIEAGKFEDAI